MAYQVLSRKYRPRTFEEVVGQEHITSTLRKAIKSERIAQAYIFSGTRGTGKTTMARILAKALNCEKGPTPDPCNKCDVCATVESGDDVDVIEIDGASHNSVEDVRELRSNASYTPARSRYKIYYIDEVHMLSNAAFNALLKTLEEPPAHVKFIFATTEPHKIPLTIQSRCQRFDFRNIPADVILARLSDICGREKIKAEEAALSLVARFARGSMRDAESLLDQVASFSGKKLSLADVEQVLGVVPAEAMSGILRALGAGEASGALEAIETALSGGTAPRQLVAELIDYLRDVLVAGACGPESTLLVRSASEREMLKEDASRWSQDAVMYAMQLLSETYARMARSPQSRGLLDVAILKLARTDDFLKLREFLAAVRSGDAGLSGGPRGNDRLPFDEPGVAREGKPSTPHENAVEAVKDAVRRGGAVASAVMEKCSLRIDAGRIIISMPPGHGFHKTVFEKSDMRRAIEDAASGELGREMRLEVIAAPNGGPGARRSQPASAKKAQLREKVLEDPAVSRILEAFDGSLVELEE